jgi:hypothetical protein
MSNGVWSSAKQKFMPPSADEIITHGSLVFLSFQFFHAFCTTSGKVKSMRALSLSSENLRSK